MNAEDSFSIMLDDAFPMSKRYLALGPLRDRVAITNPEVLRTLQVRVQALIAELRSLEPSDKTTKSALLRQLEGEFAWLPAGTSVAINSSAGPAMGTWIAGTEPVSVTQQFVGYFGASCPGRSFTVDRPTYVGGGIWR